MCQFAAGVGEYKGGQKAGDFVDNVAAKTETDKRDLDEELWERDVLNDFEDLSSRDLEQELYARNPLVKGVGRQAVTTLRTTATTATRTTGRKVVTSIPPPGTQIGRKVATSIPPPGTGTKVGSKVVKGLQIGGMGTAATLASVRPFFFPPLSRGLIRFRFSSSVAVSSRGGSRQGTWQTGKS